MRKMDKPLEPDHTPADHPVGGSPYDVMKQVMARHLCGWISGHGAPIEHFLVDADLIMREAHEHGVRFALAAPHGTCNPSAEFIDSRMSTSSAG